MTAQHVWKHGLSVEQFREKYSTISFGNEATSRVLQQRKHERIIKNNIRCKQCGKLILQPGYTNRIFCNSSCAATFNNLKGRPKDVEKVCIFCSQKYLVSRFRAGRRKYCSNKCMTDSNKKRRISQTCDNCQSPFEMRQYKIGKSDYYFCGAKCKHEFFKKNSKLRGTFAGNGGKYQQSTYRKLAFANFAPRCFYCGYDKHKEILQVHHIDGNRKNNILENLKIICPSCHALDHLGLL